MSTAESDLAGLGARERLLQSRERLRRALYASASPPGQAANQHFGELVKELLCGLEAIPAVSAVTDAARDLAKRHPLGLVAGGFLVGTLIGWSRPWRWNVTPALLARLFSQLLRP
jgi:hypothetical protein